MKHLALAASSLAVASVVLGCGGGDPITSTGAGGSTTATTSTGGTGGAGGSSSASGGATSSGGAGGGTSSSGGSTTTTTTTTTTGTGGSGPGWPTCDAQPDNVPLLTIHEIWQMNPATAKEAWVPGVFVTAVSGGACSAGAPCQFFVQQKETFATPAEGKQQALRVTVFPDASEHFTGVAVGDRVDLRAYVYRHTQNGENELMFHVSQALPGCAKTVGTGTLVPVPGLALADLTLAAYEETMGPLFIRLDTVSGKPKAPDQTFGLFESFMPGGGPIEEVTSMSPFCLPGGQFTGLTPNVINDFAHVDGVFGIFAPDAVPLVKYEEIYVRSMDDAALAGP